MHQINYRLRRDFFYESTDVDDGRRYTALVYAARGDGMWF